MNKAATTRLRAIVSDLQRVEEALAETKQILKELKRDRKLHPPPGRRKVSIVEEIKTVLGIK